MVWGGRPGSPVGAAEGPGASTRGGLRSWQRRKARRGPCSGRTGCRRPLAPASSRFPLAAHREPGPPWRMGRFLSWDPRTSLGESVNTHRYPQNVSRVQEPAYSWERTRGSPTLSEEPGRNHEFTHCYGKPGFGRPGPPPLPPLLPDLGTSLVLCCLNCTARGWPRPVSTRRSPCPPPRCCRRH